jgi:hypothetical protein
MSHTSHTFEAPGPPGRAWREVSGSGAKITGILGGVFVGAGGAIGYLSVILFFTAVPGWIWASSITSLLLGLSLVAISLVEPFKRLSISVRIPRQRGQQDSPPRNEDGPPRLTHLWATGQAARPTIDLAKIGLPPGVSSGISISQALEELRAED